jgi:hypothetical protein
MGILVAAADEGALAGCEAEGREQVRGVDVERCIEGCCCGAVGEGGADDAGVDAVGLRGIGEGGFEGEGVGLEPGEEGGCAEYAGVGVLGGVDVCV